MKTFPPLIAAIILLSAFPTQAAKTSNSPQVAQLSGDQAIRHALNRLAFGARPGDVERIRQIGLSSWIQQQINPNSVDDSAVDQKIARLQLLSETPARLQLAFASDTIGVIKKVIEAQERMEAGPNGQQPKAPAPQLNPNQQRLLEMIGNSGIEQGTSSQAVGELSVAKLTRAVESNRQLQEVMVDFWSNHFSVDVRKNAVRAFKVVDDRETIRPYALGKFRDLLSASAKSPAMLIYLDNAQSSRAVDEKDQRGFRPRLGANQRGRLGGLNENYARELMELHTLGVDGGYTQKDVQEVARCLTGWTIDRTRGTFRFQAFMHDDGEKTVLGQRIPAGGGQRDGETVLDILAKHPATANFIARKLCVRFVADAPPQELVDRVAKRFAESDGDIKQVMQTLVAAPEFWSPKFYRGKIKSPFEYAVSSVRGLGGMVQIPDANTPRGRFQLIASGAASLRDNGPPKGRLNQGRSTLATQVAAMGQPLWAHQSPDGYPEDSSEWVSSGALISRLNFALALTGGEVSDAPVTLTNLLQGATGDDGPASLSQLLNQLLGGEVSQSTRATLEKQLPAPGTPVNPAKLCALILGSPEFQRR